MKSLSTSLTSLLIFTLGSATHSAEAAPTNSADDWLGHATYFRATIFDPASPVKQARDTVDAMIGKDQITSIGANQQQKREALKMAQMELSDLNRQLGRSLLKQDVVIVVALSGTALFATSLAGRIGLEGSERLIGAAEFAVPDRKALGWLNRTLVGTKGFLDRFGRAASRIAIISGVVGSAGTLYLFYCEREDVKRLAVAVAHSLVQVEQLIATLDFVDQRPK